MNAIDSLGREKWVLLETRKRDGTWVGTPVSIVQDQTGRAYFRAYDASGKAKRLRNFPEVRVTASSARGKKRGATATGVTRLLGEDEALGVRKLLAKKYPILQGWLVPAMHKRKGWTTLHYELTLDPS
jgi:PPOX class probable F420-dependent enzyme